VIILASAADSFRDVAQGLSYVVPSFLLIINLWKTWTNGKVNVAITADTKAAVVTTAAVQTETLSQIKTAVNGASDKRVADAIAATEHRIRTEAAAISEANTAAILKEVAASAALVVAAAAKAAARALHEEKSAGRVVKGRKTGRVVK